ncbi:hypothetical protein TeGR_g13429, partial [Tetraparma gracilis]
PPPPPPRTNVNSLSYSPFPRRRNSEAAVIEWGHSAIINAVDGVAATFGVQPGRGAFFEVEASPLLGDPLDARPPEGGGAPLLNCAEARGNILVLTSGAGASAVELALVAKACEAAALVVVHVFPDGEPEYIFPMEPGEGEAAAAAGIDFPVVMISLTSGNMLASAGEGGAGLPERVRMYAGGDRPYFEDVTVASPMVYLIHNLLATDAECEYLMRAGEGVVAEFTGEANYLEGTEEVLSPEGKAKVDRGMYWRGALKDPTLKAIDERMYSAGGFHAPHYDSLQSLYHEQSASILIFLNDPVGEGGDVIFPAADPPIKIRPKKGMGVVWHNSDQSGGVDNNSVHGELRFTPAEEGGVKWTAKKWIYSQPLGKARTVLLPAALFPAGGRSPQWLRRLYNRFLKELGPDAGSERFDSCVKAAFVGLALALLYLVKFLVDKPQPRREDAEEGDAEGEKKKK